MARTESIRCISSAILIVILLVPSFNAIASHPWSEEGPGFIGGEMDGLQLKEAGLELGNIEGIEGCWTGMSEGDPIRFSHGMVYHGNSGLMVTFGGHHSYSMINSTYTFNVTTKAWNRVALAPTPPRRDWFAMAYDSRADRVVVFGGTIGEYIYANDTWTYDLRNDTWKNVTPASSPPAREMGQMVYDERNGLMILYGGHGKSGGYGVAYNDTWAYNVSANSWTELKPANPPKGRYLHSTAYDSGSGLMVLFGGGLNAEYNDTWVYEYATNTWTEKNPATRPAPRKMHSMDYDQGLGATLLFGGFVQNQGCQNDLWAYNVTRNDWTLIEPPSGPPGLWCQAMAYDARNNLTVLLGGLNDSREAGMGTWLYDSAKNVWTNLTCPRMVSGHSMYYDPVKKRTLLFGGNPYGGATGYGCADLYSYDLASNRWMQEEPIPAPVARTGQSMAYDVKNGVAVLFGGEHDNGRVYNETWTYNSTTAKWTNVTPAESPPVMYSAAMAYDQAGERIVLFGGWPKNETWIYDTANNTWKDARPARGPPLFGYPRMVYDQAGVMVLFGEQNETWTYDLEKNTWTNMSPPCSPALGACCAAYDERLGLLVCFSGYNDTSITNETWVYDVGANRWTRLDIGRRPPGRGLGALSYDAGAEAFVLFAGSQNGPEYGTDTWTLRLDGDPVLSGNYTSRAFDTGGRARFGSLRTSASIPGGTSLWLQLKTADTRKNLALRPFVGPDGTCSTYYKTGYERIFSGHDGDRWVRYRASLGATFRPETPVLNNVTITFNLAPNLSLGYPKGGETITGAVNISWAADDPDGDALRFAILLLDGSNTTRLTWDLPADTMRWEWNTLAVQNGTYRVAVVAEDGNIEIPITVNATSGNFTVFHPPPPNHPPEAALLEPPDRAVVTTAGVTLKWTGSDYEGQPLTYRVHLSDYAFGTARPPPPVATTGECEYNCSGLQNDTIYFWTVIAYDGKDNGTPPAIRQFKVDLSRFDSAPAVDLVQPANGSVINATTAELAWTGSDPEGGELTYYLFFSNLSFDRFSLPKPVTTTRTARVLIPDLANGTTYFWTVIGSDGTLNSTIPGPWRFKVVLSSPETPMNRPPRITSGSTAQVVLGQTANFLVVAQDEDGDPLSYALDGNPSWAVLDKTTGEMRLSPSGVSPGNYTTTIRIEDGRGGRAEQSFVIEVLPPGKPAAQPPSCAITSPHNGSKVSNRVTVKGTASAFGRTALTWVQVRIGQADWQVADGTGNWSMSFDSTRLNNGDTVVLARAWDGHDYSETAMIKITIKNIPAAKKSFLPGFEPVLLAMAGGAAMTLCRKRRSGRKNRSGPELRQEGGAGAIKPFSSARNKWQYGCIRPHIVHFERL